MVLKSDENLLAS